jgi:hypothetical protein
MAGLTGARVAWAFGGIVIGLIVAQMIGASSFGRKVGLAA